MTPNRVNKGSKATAAILPMAVLLCVAPISAYAGNPWNPYPVQQAQPVPTPPPPPAPKPKYFEEAPAPLPSAPAPNSGPSRFAPPDLDRQLSAGPQRQPYAPPFGYQNGYQGAPVTPYANPPAYVGPPQGGYAQGYPQNYPMGGYPNPGGYGGYGPPIVGNNNSWGGMPFNNFSPFGF